MLYNAELGLMTNYMQFSPCSKLLKKLRTVLVLFLCIFSQFQASAQKGVLTVGIELKGLLPINFLNLAPKSVIEGPVKLTLDPPGGTGFGMPLRFGLSKAWTFESGIFFNRRSTNLHLTDLDSTYSGSTRFDFISYEMPVKLLSNIQMGDNVFMNVGAGVSVDMFASDVESVVGDKFHQYSFRNNWIQMSYLGSIGVEYRNKEYGTFYFGASYHRPFTPIATTDVFYYRSSTNKLTSLTSTQLDGTYFSIDICYYFKSKPKSDKPKVRYVTPDL